MTRLFQKFTVLFTVAAMLAATACSSSQVTETLDLLVAATSAAVDAAFPASAPIVAPYLTAVTNAVDFATTELASTDSDAVKAAKITAEFSQIALPNLPPGTATIVVTAINAVAKAVANFLATLPASTAELSRAPSNAFFAAVKAKAIKASKAKLAEIAQKNAAVRAKLLKAK